MIGQHAFGSKVQGLALRLMVLLALIFASPSLTLAQDDGGEKKEKKEKPEKPPKEKKEKPEKPAKEKKEKPEKPAKEKKKKKKGDEEDDAPAVSDAGDGGSDDGGDTGRRKGKKPKGFKKSKHSSPYLERANLENDSLGKYYQRPSRYRHGRPVSCGFYRRGKMSYIDKNNIYVAIRRRRRREIHVNYNKGIHDNREKPNEKPKRRDRGNKLVFKIEWLADCEYRLIFKRSKIPTKYKKGWEMDCRVVACYEDFYDCDCDIHAIMQYGSINKVLGKRDRRARDRFVEDSTMVVEQALLEQEAALNDSLAQIVEEPNPDDEIFGPIKRETGQTPELVEEPKPGNDAKKAPAPVDKPKEDKAKKEKEGDKPEKEKSEDKEKGPKEKKEKGDKEKKEKGPKEKKEKAPKEKKEKAPKEKKEKAPKEKKEKAPKEKAEKPPKEKKEKGGDDEG